MATASWMKGPGDPPRTRVRRTKGRRASDSRISLESILISGVIIAWSWGIYEVTLYFVR
jgi:hypothetical protein